MASSGVEIIIKKRDFIFKLQYSWLHRLMREKCVRTVIKSSVTQMTILKVQLLVLKITYIFTGCS